MNTQLQVRLGTDVLPAWGAGWALIPMIMEDLAPGNGAKVFAIMKGTCSARTYHDREEFSVWLD
ncbi:MAG TPA: hypothetical protein VMA97_06635 [Streptosporangiaceae bacterium]|nr:hypothetical protein [Streptosporangiaceae bacterium]